MSETPLIGLPLIEASQAQKHVTHNEALVLLDAVAQLRLASQDLGVPPTDAAEGDAYHLPVGAANEWEGQDGRLAIRSNGGWVFATPRRGWRCALGDGMTPAVFDGQSWVEGITALSPNGALTRSEIREVDVAIPAGTAVTTSAIIPKYASVQAVTGRVVNEITGTLTGWKLGVAGAPDRYASGMGTAAGSWLVGVSGTPTAYYADTPLELTAEGGSFAGGLLRLALHMSRVAPPD